MIVSSEIRAARALLGWNQVELAKAASVGVATVRRLETAGALKGNVETVRKIQRALEDAGIEFLHHDRISKKDRFAKRTQLLRRSGKQAYSNSFKRLLIGTATRFGSKSRAKWGDVSFCDAVRQLDQ